MSVLLRFQDVTFGYERHPAVHHLSGELHMGALLAIVGPNGAGKSSLLKGMVGLLRPLAGRILAHGLTQADIAYLPQQVEIDRDFPISVFDTVLVGHWHATGPFRRINHSQNARALAALNAVGLEGFERRLIGSLSAGQFQRVLFARMMLQDARLILLDEPFSAIDARTTADLSRLIAQWHVEQRTIIAVLHDFEQVRTHFPEVLLLARELVAWGPTNLVLNPENLRRARAMAEAWDDSAPFCERKVR